jgi:hypothetical protein
MEWLSEYVVFRSVRIQPTREGCSDKKERNTSEEIGKEREREIRTVPFQ